MAGCVFLVAPCGRVRGVLRSLAPPAHSGGVYRHCLCRGSRGRQACGGGMCENDGSLPSRALSCVCVCVIWWHCEHMFVLRCFTAVGRSVSWQ